ncbi:MAG: DUF885 domain-containing protein [Sporichthyaceae bacterium]|nr:DUF885 domain-containing protein [Sporichthyaceae bacterium]
MTRIDELADRYVDAACALDPNQATYIGVAGYDDQLTDYGPEARAARAELARQVLSDLGDAPIETDNDRVCVTAMRERLGLELELHDAGELDGDLNVIESPVQSTRQVFDLMPTEGEDAWRTIATRMSAVPAALAAYRRSLVQARDGGRVAARRQVLACAGQCTQWTSGEDGGFFGHLVAGSGMQGEIRTDLETAARAASQAYAELGTFLRDELAPHAPEHDGVGRERYALWSRYFLGAEIDLDETYAWGLEELARIEQEMAAVADQIVPGGSVADAQAVLEADPARKLAGPDALQAWMQQISDRVVSELADVHFDIPQEIRNLECRIAPTKDGGIYYTGPSEDFSRPGRMWWSVPVGVTEFSTWREVTTVFHEGVPGHHLQVAQTTYRSDVLNRWQRLMCWVSGHGEGWALYAERLMADLGYLDDHGDRLGMLDAQAFRAARVVIDIGMHLGLEIPAGTGFHDGETWDPELGLEFLRAHNSMADEFLRFELDRYLGWPGQAPSYKVGERIWLQARDEVRARQGDQFDLKAFHRRALDLGGLGLDPLRAELARL